METSPFARLPAELRNEIYTYALYVPEGVWLKNEKDEEKTKPIETLRLQASRNLTALTMTCRQIHAEAERLFYSINRFSIRPFSLGPHGFFQRKNELLWVRKIRAWMNIVGFPNASCISKLCLHVRNCHTLWDPNNFFLDGIVCVVPSKRRCWPDSLQVSLNFALEFHDLESSNSTSDVWVATPFELPLHDWSEAKRQIDLVFDEKLIRLRELLKRTEEEILRKQEKGMEDTSEQLPQTLDPGDALRKERSVRDIKANMHDVKLWKMYFLEFVEDEFPRLRCAEICVPDQSPYTSSDDSGSK